MPVISRLIMRLAWWLLSLLGVAGLAQAQSLPAGGAVSGVIISASAQHSYSIAAGVGETLRMSAARSSGNLSPFIQLFDPQGTRVTWGGTGGTTSVLEHVAATAGTYTVVVSNSYATGDYSGGYVLHSVKAPGASEGGALSQGHSVRGRIDIGDLDTFTISAQAGHTMLLSVAKADNENLFPFVALYDPSGKRVTWGGTGGTTSLLSHVAATSGTYTVLVTNSYAGSYSGDYTLHYVRAPGANEGGTLSSGGAHKGRIDLGDLDTFTLQAQAGHTILLSAAKADEENLSPFVALYDPSGKRVTWGGTGGTTSILTYVAATSGTYTVLVSSSYAGSYTGDYTLHYVRAPSANEGGALNNGGAHPGRIDLGDLDSYTLHAQSGHTIRLSVAKADAENLSPFVALYDPSGQRVTWGGTGGYTSSLEHQARTTGTYTALVYSSYAGSYTGNYTLHYAKAPGANEGGAIGGGTIRAGFIDPGDLDSYTISALAGEAIEVSATRSGSGNLLPFVALYDPSGQRVTWGGTGSATSSLRHVANVTGTYTVIVSNSYAGQYSGGYQVSLARMGPRLSYAALGDSYSSGEGLLPYQNPNDVWWWMEGCHRSNRAYAMQIRLPGGSGPIATRASTDFDFLACSGAETKHMRAGGTPLHDLPPQLSAGNAIDATRDLITVTIGGNDAQWSNIIKYCMVHAACDAARPFDPHTNVTLGDIATLLLIAYAEAGINDIHASLRQAAPNAAIVVFGYPMLVSGMECPALQIPGIPEAKLSADEQAFLRKANGLLNDAIARSASRHGLHHIPVAEHFKGHEACGALDDWVNGLVPYNIPSSFHPTARGQAEYARLFNQYMQAAANNWPHGYLGSGLPRNPTPVPVAASVAQGLPPSPQAQSIPASTALPSFGELFVRPGTAPLSCAGAQGVLVPGKEATFSGQGFQAGEVVTVSLVIRHQRIPLGTLTANAEGVIDGRLVVPADVASGDAGSAEVLGRGANGTGLLLLAIVRADANALADTDGDGVADICDNCSATPNPTQADVDQDGYGNRCDADLDNNGMVNTLDLALFKAAFGKSGEGLAADLDGNFVVNTLDLALFNSLFGKPPGPARGVITPAPAP